MTRKPRSGEPGAARLLELARRELLQAVLPQLQGEHRYRARLVANALKIAARELEGDPADEVESALRRFAAEALPGDLDSAAMTEAEIAAALVEGLRAGRLDGERALHELLLRLTEDRRARVA